MLHAHLLERSCLNFIRVFRKNKQTDRQTDPHTDPRADGLTDTQMIRQYGKLMVNALQPSKPDGEAETNLRGTS